jgi:nucleotidyltransferase/DNA polymerase involved in DNA repair
MALGAVKKERITGLRRRPQRGRDHFQAMRQLGDLISIGPAMLRDFELLGIRSVAQLARQNPQRLYEKLGRVARQHQDICVLDVFCAAVAQARNPRLPAEQCQWWYWSRERKTGKK